MLEIRNLTIGFPAKENTLLMVRDFSLTMGEHTKTIILGESGSGKSLVLLAIMCLLPPDAQCRGEILFQGKNVGQMEAADLERLRGGRVAYIPQGCGNSLNPLSRIGRQVTERLPLEKGETLWQKAIRILRPFDFKDPAKTVRAYPHMLSGGMKQRVLIAMGVARNALLTLADEPTKGLDPSRIEGVLDAFRQLKDRAFLCVTHDLSFARDFADEIVVMYAGSQMEISAKEDFFRKPLHPYGEALLAALPENGLHNLTGFAPPHTAGERGQCVFYDRCPKRFSTCEKQPPLFIQDGRKVRCWRYAVKAAADNRTL